MCGIFGFTRFHENELETARASLHTLHHRGPDQWNDYYDSDLYIGHQRLSILDLSEHGKQPMVSPDGNVIISVNGEIYNFLELRHQLESRYRFNSTSDSEVILYGYIEWGIDALLEKIDGMYAICIYDKTAGRLFLVRDRAGIKPLFYSTVHNRIAWASELKALQHLYRDRLEYDYTALYDFLTYRYIPVPKTMYRDVHKLEPAHYLTIDIRTNARTKTRYWSIPDTACNDDLETAKEKLHALVKASVEEQMIADVPVGFFLSGGMDSSTVVAVAAENHQDLHTFSIGFTDEAHDETRYAEMIAQKYQTNHYKKILDEMTTGDLFSRMKEWYDEPYGDTSCFPTFLVSELAKQHSTVVLTGDGGDEVFGGYKRYKRFARLKRQNIPSLRFLRPLLREAQAFTLFKRAADRFESQYLLDDLEIYTKMMGGMLRQDKETYRKMWNIPDEYDDYWYFRQYYREDLDLFTRLQYLDFHTYLHDDILTKVDRVSMAVSLECRVPFLSRAIIEYAFSLKKEVRICHGELKGLMKQAFKSLLPIEIIEREKKGFSIPTGSRKAFNAGENKRQERILKDFITF